ncbi:MAG: glycosyltransferase [Candidatus Nomurabacteria bacterium]|nr:glycosyltransferase [Candidatus Nomurabacteria bacterium]USN88137.1 MAG: glycosyltransferase [Candidatus Nomurabacteria bacterium]
MARKNLSRTDASEFERYSLDYVLEREKRARDDTRYVSVEEAINDDSVYEVRSDRDETRVLFISQDESLLNPTQQSLDGYTNISDLFDEVHILILRQGIRAKNPTLRVADNVWLYTASDKDWWHTPWSGMALTEDQLVFAGGFRPDLIVARDPFESAFLANRLGKKYNRPVQIHVLEDYTQADFLKKSKHNRWRRYLPHFTISKVKSVRTSTKAIAELIQNKFSVEDLAVLPRFNNYESLIKIQSTLDLRAKFKPLVFIMLYIGELDYDSAAYRAIDAARFGLKNPHIGLVIVGDGPAKKELQERAETFGIKEQVIFETNVKDVVPYLKSATVLIIPDTDSESEEVALQGAAAGIPMVVARTAAREDIFIDGESALLCAPDNTDEFSLKLNILMNDVPLRGRMVETAQAMIVKKFHDDPKRYLATYRESIEQVFFVGDSSAEGK